ncbi:hypothetical protein ACFC26_14945 [Kitasatospora purpeofusca]|uniref:hypothetical protein n=1 Tax=Kitasatospora purpeofusca TaxID=67352 RepID=UPI0035DB1346
MSPSRIAAAKGNAGARSRSGMPEERLYLFWVDGSDNGPYPGLVGPSHTVGHLGAYSTAGFTREVAGRIVDDLLADDYGLTAQWGSEGTLRFTWPAAHDGVGGIQECEPDERGLYRIGGLWPWDYSNVPAPEPLHRADAARAHTWSRTGAGLASAASSPAPEHTEAPGRRR